MKIYNIVAINLSTCYFHLIEHIFVARQDIFGFKWINDKQYYFLYIIYIEMINYFEKHIILRFCIQSSL